MSTNQEKFCLFRLTFETITQREWEAEQRKQEEEYLDGDWDAPISDREQSKRINYIEMPLSAVVYFERDLDELIDKLMKISTIDQNSF